MSKVLMCRTLYVSLREIPAVRPWALSRIYLHLAFRHAAVVPAELSRNLVRHVGARAFLSRCSPSVNFALNSKVLHTAFAGPSVDCPFFLRHFATSSSFLAENDAKPKPSPVPPKPPSSENSSGQEKKQDNDEDDDDEPRMSMGARLLAWAAVAYCTVAVLTMLMPNSESGEGMRFISWHEFVYEMLQNGEVQQIIIRPDASVATIHLFDGAIIKGRRAEHRTYHLMLPDVGKFENKLRETEQELGIRPGFEVPVIVERDQEMAWLLLLSLVAASIMVLWMFRSGTIKPPQLSDMFSGMTRAKFTLLDPLTSRGKGVTFAQVAGLREAKQEVMELVSYLKDQKIYRDLGAKIPKGVLLLGPPGCGKTLLAKAIATEASVPFLSMAGTEFVEMIGGLGAARVRDLFKEARRRAPCIIYIDEIDAIGRKRSGEGRGGSGEEEQTLNQLLVEMDGMTSSEGVMLLASTNRPDILDRALQRPGRFDRHITIDLPTALDREEIFQVYLKQIKLKGNVEKFAKHFAKVTAGMTGADIANVVNESAIHAASRSKTMVDREDMEAALERVVAGTEKRSNVLSPQEKRIVAYHEAGHALVGWLQQRTDALLRLSIRPRTSTVLGFSWDQDNERKLFSNEDFLEKMAMILGGRAAEALIFNSITQGAQNDLEKVTKMAYAQVRTYGMNANIGLVSFPEVDGDEQAKFLTKPYSKRLAKMIDEEARKLVATAYFRAQQILTDNQDKLVKVAENLLLKEQMNYEDMEKLIGPPPFGAKAMISPSDWDNFIAEDIKDIKTPTDLPTAQDATPPSKENGSDDKNEKKA
ncbi:paraplegin-like isoform X2 [Paramacrobiotus metropolitanus]|uniref:paraplegin-like isoform X2 n=1 Tax=Paramacrobiotus metropolitanus TaxID=2943436 RepID=UPI0024455F50|nr:paraplegin-like isoform X2 [Paramacrobiotus metropolitanus]